MLLLRMLRAAGARSAASQIPQQVGHKVTASAMLVNKKDRIGTSSMHGVIGLSEGLRNFASPAGSDLLEKEEVVYDPDREEKEMKFDQMVKSISRIERKEESELLHGEDGGTIYKYDLPVLNQPIVFHNKLMVIDQEKEALTQVQELFDILDCDKDTAYESFIIKFNQEYNHEVDMYGDI